MEIMNKTEVALQRKQVNALFGVENSGAFISDNIQKNKTVCLDDYKAIFQANGMNTALQFRLVEAYATSAAFVVLSTLII